MFNRSGKSTPVVIAVLWVAGLILVGCDGTGSGTEAAGGVEGLGGAGGVGGVGGAGGIGGSASCASGETCGIPVTTQPPQNENPCIAYYQGSACGVPGYATCGWDSSTNECWPTAWCEPSVPSVVANEEWSVVIAGYTTTYFAPIMLRPVSAVCGAGVATVTYAPGTLMVWGYSATPTKNGFIKGSPYEGSVIQGAAGDDGYRCVTNNLPVTINC